MGKSFTKAKGGSTKADVPPRRIGMTVDQLIDLMEANGIENANQLALKLNVHRSVAWKWINDKSKITLGTAAMIRAALPKKSKKK